MSNEIENNSGKKTKIMIVGILAVTILILSSVLCLSIYNKGEANKTTSKVDKAEKYTINFIMEDGTVAAIEVEEGGIIPIPPEPTKEGYIFTGWLLDGKPYDFSEPIGDDMVLEPSWQEKVPDKVYYKVYFDTVDGSFITTQEVEEGSLVERPINNPVKDGYEFKGWKLSGTDYNFDEPVHSDITLVAEWKKIPIKNPEVVTSSKTTSSTTAKTTSTTTSKYSNSNVNTTAKTTSSSTSPILKKYTVKFNANGGSLGSGCSNQTIESGKKAKNTCTATRDGYTLVGFNTSKTANSSNIESLSITNNTTYYAIWKKNLPIKYHITYNDNNTYQAGMDWYTHIEYPGKYSTLEKDFYCTLGDSSKDQNCKLKTYEELFGNNYKKRRVFVGWSPNAKQATSFYSPDKSSKEDFINILNKAAVESTGKCDEGYVCKDVKLYAIWHYEIIWDYDRNDPTIRFAKGYSEKDLQKSFMNQAGYGFIKYVELERDGYIFKGWKDIQYTGSFTLVGDRDLSNNVSWCVPLHLTAVWEKISD